MPRRALVLVLALWSAQALAHDPRSAAVEVEVTESAATVHLAVSQAGLHAALEAGVGRSVDTQAEDYRALVADHLRRTLGLSADGHELTVSDIGLRLGSHQSDARFAVELPSGTEMLTVAVDVLDGVEGHQTIVRVRHRGDTTRAVLSEAMGGTVTVAVSEPVASRADSGTAAAPGPLRAGRAWALSLVAIAVVLLLIGMTRRSATTT
ncbi:MAG: hypothetical protein ABJF88_00225 [Rhodothermales bacterium]